MTWQALFEDRRQALRGFLDFNSSYDRDVRRRIAQAPFAELYRLRKAIASISMNSGAVTAQGMPRKSRAQK